MKKIFFIISIISFSFLNVSCSLFSPVNVKPATSYELNQIPDVPKEEKHRANILVLLPDEVSAYSTRSMAYSLRPYEISYYSQSKWSDTPGQMLQPLVVQTLQKTNYFQSVATPPFGGRYDYMLALQVLRLEQDFTQHPALLVFSLRAQLNRFFTNRMIASKEIYVTRPMLHNDAYSGVIAANQATQELLIKLSNFVIENAK